jgi:hypothetical protein
MARKRCLVDNSVDRAWWKIRVERRLRGAANAAGDPRTAGRVPDAVSGVS